MDNAMAFLAALENNKKIKTIDFRSAAIAFEISIIKEDLKHTQRAAVLQAITSIYFAAHDSKFKLINQVQETSAAISKVYSLIQREGEQFYSYQFLRSFYTAQLGEFTKLSSACAEFTAHARINKKSYRWDTLIGMCLVLATQLETVPDLITLFTNVTQILNPFLPTFEKMDCKFYCSEL